MCVNVAFLTHLGESTLKLFLLRFQPIFNFVEPCRPLRLIHLKCQGVQTLAGTFQSICPLGDAFYKSKCPSVCPCVCPSVHLFTFEVPFKHLFAPTSRSRMSNIFRDLESLGKSNGKKWSQIETFLFKPLVLWSKGVSLIFGISLDVFEFLCFGWFFPFSKKIRFLGILGPTGNHASRWIRDLWSKCVSQILAYF